MINVTLIPILTDNYAYILHCSNSEIVVVDPGEAQPIIDYLESNNLALSAILNTHHHGDHIAGNAVLKAKYNCPLIGPSYESARIPDMDQSYSAGDTFTLCGEEIQVIHTPGHTSGHVCFYALQSGILFAGDTLFVMGCGRLFEGSAEDMFESLQKLAALPDETLIFCGHEYTLSNAKFCLSVEPENEALVKRAADVQAMRDARQPTMPTTLALEKATNVFLRSKNADEFAHRRALKDNS